MAKMLFINPSLIYGNWMHMGIASLSAHLKKHGHKVELYDAGKKVRQDWTNYVFEDEVNLIELIRRCKPDIIGFTVLNTNFRFVLYLASVIKSKFEIPIILGGPHPTVCPDECIAQKNIDMICIGEGEESLCELMNKIDKKHGITHIKNIWLKFGGTIIKNEIRPLIKDLDSLPFPDRKLFEDNDNEQFMTGRGCPYQCSFCINHRLMKLYHGQNFVRYRSIDSVFDEIKEVDKRKYIEKIGFIDETFTMNKQRTIEFCERYSDEIAIPFTVQTRANTLDKDVTEALKKAGCYMTLIGIESANDEIRNTTLRKGITKEQVINAFKCVKDVDIASFSFNIIGVPGETKNTIMETINFNKLIKPSRKQHSIYCPLKGTDLGDYCYEKGYVREEPTKGFYIQSFIDIPTMTSNKIDSYISTLPLYYALPKQFYFIADIVRNIINPLPIKYKRYPRALFRKMFPMEKDVIVPKRS